MIERILPYLCARRVNSDKWIAGYFICLFNTGYMTHKKTKIENGKTVEYYSGFVVEVDMHTLMEYEGNKTFDINWDVDNPLDQKTQK